MNSPLACTHCTALIPLPNLGQHVTRLHIHSGVRLSWPCTDCSFAASDLDSGLAHCLLAGHAWFGDGERKRQGRTDIKVELIPPQDAPPPKKSGHEEATLSTYDITLPELQASCTDISSATNESIAPIAIERECNASADIVTLEESRISIPGSVDASFSLDVTDNELISQDFSALLDEDDQTVDTESQQSAPTNKKRKSKDPGFKEPRFSDLKLRLPGSEKTLKERSEQGKRKEKIAKDDVKEKEKTEKTPIELHCFRCDATLRCDSKGTRAKTATQHALACLNIKPFACSVCGQDSVRRSNLHAHIKSRKNQACANALVVMVNEEEDKAAAKEALRQCFPAQPVSTITLG